MKYLFYARVQDHKVIAVAMKHSKKGSFTKESNSMVFFFGRKVILWFCRIVMLYILIPTHRNKLCEG